MLDRARRRSAADRAGPEAPRVPVSHASSTGCWRSSISARIADVTAPSLPACSASSRSSRASSASSCAAIPISSCSSTAPSRASTQDASGVELAIERNGRTETRSGRWLIGADGARSDVRRSLGIEFEGFTWPERFLVVQHAVRFPQRHSRPGGGELRRRPAALALPPADPRPVPRDVSGRG